jgi:hypothetical protein
LHCYGIWVWWYNRRPESFSGQRIINGAGIAGDSATILPIEAIQEFNVQENPPAEHGRKPGAIINVGLKSGTNALHGTAFAFGREGALDARLFHPCSRRRNWPHPGAVWRQFWKARFIKDQAFFFGAYEGQRYNVGNSYKQFRAEFFNIFNHPNFANPYGGQNGFGLNDPSVQPFGCGCATPDVAAANPVIGSGGSRAVQLALKFTFLDSWTLILRIYLSEFSSRK